MSTIPLTEVGYSAIPQFSAQLIEIDRTDQYRRGCRGRDLSDRPTQAQNDDLVCNLQDLRQVVADNDHRRAGISHLRIRSSTPLVCITPRLAVGSSMKIALVAHIAARATAALCRGPPERLNTSADGRIVTPSRATTDFLPTTKTVGQKNTEGRSRALLPDWNDHLLNGTTHGFEIAESCVALVADH